MNLSEQEMENALRRAPQPKAPVSLRKQLLADVHLRRAAGSQTAGTSPGFLAWLRRWWPALAPAAASLACAAVMTAQRSEIRDLNESIRALSQTPANEVGTAATTPGAQAIQSSTVADSALREQEEIARLKEQAARLATEIAMLEQTQSENASLRQQLAAPPPGLSTEELDALVKARERAMRIACVNNLKQLGLSVRVWANDNKDVFPPDILSMTNEMGTPKILVCPAETNRPVAASWSAYTPANCSYEFLAASADGTEPERLLFRCPIHNNIGLCDGSVQTLSKDRPEWIVERDGKLYFQPQPQPAKPKP